MGEEAPGTLLLCRAASKAGAAAKLLQAGAESGLSRYYCIFFGYAVVPPPQPASLVFPSYLQPFLKAARSPNPTEHHHDSGRDFYTVGEGFVCVGRAEWGLYRKGCIFLICSLPCINAPCNPPLTKV